MKKRILCGALSAAILVGVSPVTALAEDSLNVLDTKVMDFRNQEEDASGEGWYWDANGQTLTLDGFRYSVPYNKLEDSAAIYLPEDSYVEIEGDDNVLETHSFHCDAFYCEGEVNFYGDGKLALSLDSYGANAIYVEKGPLLIDDEAEITVESSGYIIYLNNARGTNPLISIKDDAKLIFNKKDHKDRNILLTKKSQVHTSSNWLDYAEVEDTWDDDYINLVAKETVKASEKEEPPVSAEKPDDSQKQNEYKIVVGSPSIEKNGKISYTADVSPYLSNGYTMLPLRALLEVSDPEQEVKWSAEQKAAYTFVNNKLVVINPGQDTYKKGTEKIELSTPAETKNGRLFVSLRDWMSIMEMSSSQLNWDSETKTITLTY